MSKRLVVLLCLISLSMATCKDVPTETQDELIDLLITPSTATLNVGGTQTVTAEVKGGPASTDRTAVEFISSAPGVISVTGSGLTRTLTALTAGQSDITVRHTPSGKSVALGVQVRTPSVVFDAVRTPSGAAASTDSMAGIRDIFYRVSNFSPGSQLKVQLGTGADAVMYACDPLVTEGAAVRCRVNTAELSDSLTPIQRGRFPNGSGFGAGFLFIPGSNTTLPVVTTPLTFKNTNSITVTRNDPPAQPGGGIMWRAGEITVTLRPVIFDNIPTANLRIAAQNVRVSGTGDALFNQSGPIASPFVFTIDPGASSSAEGLFNTNFTIFNGATNITNTFPGIAPFPTNIDFVPPRVTFANNLPGTTALSQSVVTLKYQTGPYAPNTVMPMSRVIGGIVEPAHVPNCGFTHLHGTISITRDPPPGSDGPFGDPQGTTGDPCGHGLIGSQAMTRLQMNLIGSVQDAGPILTRLQLVRGVNGCDGLSIVDDVPIIQGNSIGQSPTPDQTFPPAANWSAPVDFFVGPATAGTTLCVRQTFEDAAVNPQGVRTNRTFRVQGTTFNSGSIQVAPVSSHH